MKLNLRTKLSLMISLIVIIAVSAVSISIYLFQRDQILKTHTEQQKKIITTLTQVAKESILTEDDLLLLNYITTLKNTEEILNLILVIDNHNKILAHHEPKLLGMRFSQELLQNNEKTLIKESDVKIAGKSVAKVVVGFSKEVSEKIIRKSLRKVFTYILSVCCLTLIIGIFTANLFGYYISQPIKILSKATSLVSQGDLNVTTKINTGDELEKLSNDFNLMIKKLKELCPNER